MSSQTGLSGEVDVTAAHTSRGAVTLDAVGEERHDGIVGQGGWAWSGALGHTKFVLTHTSASGPEPGRHVRGETRC